jgi:dihydroneopterin aldolase
MVIYAHHGAFEEERKLGQRFEIDVELGLDLEQAALADRLDQSIDYEQAYKLIYDSVTEKRFHLIEALAHHIIKKLLDTFPIESVTVRIRKPNVPINGSLDHVEVELTRTRT